MKGKIIFGGLSSLLIILHVLAFIWSEQSVVVLGSAIAGVVILCVWSGLALYHRQAVLLASAGAYSLSLALVAGSTLVANQMTTVNFVNLTQLSKEVFAPFATIITQQPALFFGISLIFGALLLASASVIGVQKRGSWQLQAVGTPPWLKKTLIGLIIAINTIIVGFMIYSVNLIFQSPAADIDSMRLVISGSVWFVSISLWIALYWLAYTYQQRWVLKLTLPVWLAIAISLMLFLAITTNAQSGLMSLDFFVKLWAIFMLYPLIEFPQLIVQMTGLVAQNYYAIWPLVTLPLLGVGTTLWLWLKITYDNQKNS